MVVKTVKLPRHVAAALTRSAKRRGCTESELIREGVEAVVNAEGGIDMQELIGADLGVGRGPPDLSSNRRRLSRYGRSRHR